LQSPFGYYGIGSIANHCFYHDIFAAAMVSALSLPNSIISLAFLLAIHVGGATTSNKRYCNKLALSSLVNNQNESSRLASLGGI
jgi:hypothetical protein